MPRKRLVLSLALAPAAGAAASSAGWAPYLGGCAEIGGAGFRLDRLREWRGKELAARVRFELIGRPLGAPRAAIARALLEVRFRRREPAGGTGLEIVAA